MRIRLFEITFDSRHLKTIASTNRDQDLKRFNIGPFRIVQLTDCVCSSILQ